MDDNNLSQNEIDDKYAQTKEELAHNLPTNSRRDKRISIIDDDYQITHVLDYELTKIGYTVARAQNADDGIAIIAGDQPDLVILDMAMPGKDGEAMLKELRTYDWGKDVPVLIYSNYDEYVRLAEDPKLAPVKYAAKTKYSIDEMVNIIEGLLGE